MTEIKSTPSRNDHYVNQMAAINKIMMDASRNAADLALERTKKSMEMSMNQTTWLFQKWRDAIDMWGQACYNGGKAATQIAGDRIARSGKIVNKAGEDNECTMKGLSRIPRFVFPKTS